MKTCIGLFFFFSAILIGCGNIPDKDVEISTSETQTSQLASFDDCGSDYFGNLKKALGILDNNWACRPWLWYYSYL
ncbi:MAG: hypothetical protein JW841_00135 [Deltaproteobacteria bacterium]|nr:hypothetical protein [Deltaproteobacteria bacterium]